MPKNEALDKKRHSLAHLMAASIQEMFPEARFGVGPVVEDGFYYDVTVGRPLTPEDLTGIEKKMRQKVSQGLSFDRSEISTDEAITMFAKNVKDHPDSWNAHDSLADAYVAKGDRKQALEHYTKAMAMTKVDLQKTRLAGVIEQLKKSSQ